jgi:hypothetical protein
MFTEFSEEDKNTINSQILRDIKEPILSIESFTQLWPDLGGAFSEPGYIYGDALAVNITTIVEISEDKGSVYFNGKFGYNVNLLNSEFIKDRNEKNLVSIAFQKSNNFYK